MDSIALSAMVKTGSGRVGRLHGPPSGTQLEVIKALEDAGYPAQWEGRENFYEEVHFKGIDRLDYAGPMCEIWVEFTVPRTLQGAKLMVDCPQPYRGKVRTLYLEAFEIITNHHVVR